MAAFLCGICNCQGNAETEEAARAAGWSLYDNYLPGESAWTCPSCTAGSHVDVNNIDLYRLFKEATPGGLRILTARLLNHCFAENASNVACELLFATAVSILAAGRCCSDDKDTKSLAALILPEVVGFVDASLALSDDATGLVDRIAAKLPEMPLWATPSAQA